MVAGGLLKHLLIALPLATTAWIAIYRRQQLALWLIVSLSAAAAAIAIAIVYLTQGAERPAIQVACAGSLVADDIGTLDILGLTGSPWIGRSLTGIVDFPAFSIPPGSRRGVSPDERQG